MRRVVAVGQAVEHPGRALGAAVARVGAERRRTGSRPSPRNSARGCLHQQADLPMAGVIAQRDRLARPARATPPCVLRIRNCLRPSSRGSQPMPAFWVSPNRSPLGRFSSISSVSGSAPAGPGAFVRIW